MNCRLTRTQHQLTEVGPGPHPQRRALWLRKLAPLLVCSLTLTAPLWALAQSASPLPAPTWPQKPVTLIAPFAAGGSTDMLARVVAQALSKQLGQSVIVDNRAGAGGTIGAGMTAKSAPDGYTLLLANVSLTSAGALYKSLPYEFDRDLTAVHLLATAPFVLLTNKEIAPKTLPEFVKYLKTPGSKINFGSSGIGAAPHLVVQSFLTEAKAEATHVPYRGSGPMMIDLIAGNVQFAIDTAASASAQIKGGKVNGLAVTSLKRSPNLPDIPTMVESGVPLDILIWYGLVAPAGVPKPIVARLHEATTLAVRTPEVLEAFSKMGINAESKSVAEFSEMIKRDKERWTTIIKTAGVVAE